MLSEEGFQMNKRRSGNGSAPRDPVTAARAVRPTLFVGLGGTGHRIGVHLKALFERHRDGLPEWMRLVVFDTAEDPTVATLEDGRTIGLEPGTEFVNIGRVPVGRIVRNRDKQVAIAERFGESLNQLPPTVLRHGAKQVRLLGLLALYWHFHDIEDHLKRAIWHLAGRDTARRGVVEGGRGINIFIANSMCGGTGAGTFLDVAYLVQALVDELGDLGDFCQVTGMGVLPGAFSNVDGPYLEPNTVASLMELNHAMTRRDFRAAYPNGRVIEPISAPFNLYYVIDGVDERGRVWAGINAVCRQAARALHLQIGSQLGRKGENDFDNLDEVLSGVSDEGVGTFLGGVGISVCQFDADAARTECVRWQALRLIREGWLRPLDDGSDEGTEGGIEKRAEDRAEAFWEAERLDPELLGDDLAVEDEGVPITVNPTLPGGLRRLSLEQKAQETVAYIESYRNLRVEGRFRTAIETRRKERGAVLTERLRREVLRLSEDPDLGIREAAAMLDELQSRIDTARTALQEEQGELDDQIEQLDKDLKRRATALLRAPTAGFLGRGAKVRSAQRQYLQAATAVCRADVSRYLRAASLQILDALARLRGDLSAELDRLTDRLESAAQLLTSTSRAASDGLPVDLELADPAYVAQLFDEYAPSLNETAPLCLEGGNELLDWADWTAAELAREIEQGTSQSFNGLLQHDVEVALQEDEDVSPEARRLWLLERATPSWNLDRSRLKDGGASLVSVTVLGVPDEDDTLFAEHSHMLVSTHDDRRIVALRATVGAPHTALQRFPAWKRAYEDKRGGRPLHVLPTFHTSTKTALEAFAVGLVFQLIFSQGSWYYYRPSDQLDEPQRLAQGLHNAVRAFASQEGLAQEVLERVDRHIALRLTTAEALERLDTYCAAGEAGEVTEELDRQLRKAARDYADRLRKMLTASEGILEAES